MGFVPNAKGFKVSVHSWSRKTLVVQKLVNSYLFLHVSQQFGNAWRPTDITPLEVEYPKPKSTDIERIADLVANAKRPLLLLGSQATLPPVKPQELQKIVKVSRTVSFNR